MTTKGGGKDGEKSYKSWTISDAFWEAIKDEIPERQREKGRTSLVSLIKVLEYIEY